jgi:hypothetical protein
MKLYMTNIDIIMYTLSHTHMYTQTHTYIKYFGVFEIKNRKSFRFSVLSISFFLSIESRKRSLQKLRNAVINRVTLCFSWKHKAIELDIFKFK